MKKKGKKQANSAELRPAYAGPAKKSALLGWAPLRKPTPDEVIEEALVLLENGHFEEAEGKFREVLHTSPDNFNAAFHIGRLNLERNNLYPAAGFLARAYQLAPASWEAGGLFGYALWKLGDFTTAVQLLERSADLTPDEPALLHQSLICRVMSKALTVDDDPKLWPAALRYLLEGCGNAAEQVGFLDSCGFDKSAPATHNENIFVKLALPLIRSVLAEGKLGLALKLHRYTFSRAALFPHTQEQWAKYLDRLNPLFVEAGEALRARADQRPFRDLGNTPPVVAFVVDTSVSAGSGFPVFLSMLEQVVRVRENRMIPIVYTLVPAPPALTEQCRKWAVTLIDFGSPEQNGKLGEGQLHQLETVGEHSRAVGVSLAVFFSSFEAIVCLASSFGIAPRHAYFTMFFHSIAAPRLDAYFAGASLGFATKSIRGRTWRTFPPVSPYPFPADDSPEGVEMLGEVTAIRTRLHKRFSTLLGTISRTEKLDETFIEVVARILRESPGAGFLWFGHENEPIVSRIAALFDAHGVAERCLFVGWVDTRVYSRVLDIHLNCFGLPTGITMTQTFSAAGAYVLKRGAEANHIGLTQLLASLLDGIESETHLAEAQAIFTDPEHGENLVMLAEDVEQYLNYANRLIRDPVFRGKVGAAARKFMDKYFHDSDCTGRAFVEHLIDVAGADQAPPKRRKSRVVG